MTPPKFQTPIQKIKSLEKNANYLGAFIFGSVARGDANKHSDLDVKVIVREGNPCKNINHPFIDGVKLDITFISYEQLVQAAEKERKGGRVPMILESVIVFDKTGKLEELKDSYAGLKSPKSSSADYQFHQFILYHHDEKVRRNLEEDPDTALLTMTLCLDELIKMHYLINGHWKVSSKRMLKDLDDWDFDFAQLLRGFIRENELEKKFIIWSTIVDHIAKSMGGRMSIEENNCDCENCVRDLGDLLR
jgi:hypothetical protein